MKLLKTVRNYSKHNHVFTNLTQNKFEKLIPSSNLHEPTSSYIARKSQ